MKLAYCLAFFAAQLASAACPGPGATCQALTGDDIETALRAAAATLLGPAAAAPDRLRIEVLDFAAASFPPGDLRFSYGAGPAATVDGVSTLYGHLVTPDGKQSLVWARVRSFVLRRSMVAAEDLPVRAPLDSGRVQEKDVWVAFPEAATLDVEPDEATLVGAVLKRPLKAGQILRKSMVEYPLDIRRGQTVDVHVRAGQAHLRLQGVALQNARRGETISIRTSDKEPPLTGEVTGPGAAILRTTPPAADGPREPGAPR